MKSVVLFGREILPKSRIVKNTAWMLLGFGTRLGIQLVYFIIVARVLGSSEYGAFAGILALITVLTPFTSLGSGNILIKHVARDATRFPEYWGTALAVTLVSGGILTALATGITAILFSVNRAIAIALPVAVGDLFGTRMAEMSGQAFQAHQCLSRTSLIWMFTSIYRLSGALVLLLLPMAQNAEMWAVLYSLTGLLAGATAISLVRRELGWGNLGLRLWREEWREGFYFSISHSAQGSYNDIDKTILAQALPDVAGAYAAAYRLLDASFTPIRALLYASYPRFFEEGRGGVAGTIPYALKLLRPAILVAVAISVIVLVLSPFLVPSLLGRSYILAVQIVPWLLPILIFKAVHYFGADALTGAGFQGARSALQVFVAGFNFLLNLVLIPRYGWKGAVWSSLASDGLLALLIWAVLLHRRKP